MKKLIRMSTLVLLVLGFFAVSCEKEDLAPAPVDEVKVTWTPEHSSAPITVNGDVKDGEYKKEFVIEAKLAAPPCPDGIWSIAVEAPAGKEYYGTPLNKKGKFVFIPLGLATYKVILSYKCPGCKVVTVVVNITSK
jgi:hypothetical protein